MEWSPDKSSRKNVFRVTSANGHQVLLQDDCALVCKEWFDAIKSAAAKLPSRSDTKENLSGSREQLNQNGKDCGKDASGQAKLKRSKSQKQFRAQSDSGAISQSHEDILTPLPPERRKKITERLRQFLRRRPTLESLREKGIFKDEPVFGCHLANLCARDKSAVPKFVKQTIDAIEKKDLKSDGIYRVCGNLSQVQRIRFQVNQGTARHAADCSRQITVINSLMAIFDTDNYSGLYAEEDVHVLTGLLKMFFRDMKEPLFPCNQFEALMKAISKRTRYNYQFTLARGH